MKMSIVGTILSYFKIVNLDFRKEDYKTQDNLSYWICILFTSVMLAINVFIIVYSGFINYSEDHDDSDDVQKDPVHHSLAHNHHHKLHGLVGLCSYIVVSVITVLFHLAVDEGKFNRMFYINVGRSYLILVLQLPVQVVMVLIDPPAAWVVWIIVGQMTIECLVVYAYHPVWIDVTNDTREFKTIKRTYFLENHSK